MKRNKSTATIGLFISYDLNRDYLHVKAHPVSIGLTAYEQAEVDRGDSGPRNVNSDTVRNISHTYAWERAKGELYLDNLEVYSQGSTLSTNGPRSLYAWEVQFNVSQVRREEAGHMAKTLNAIQKRLDKFEKDFGSPATYGQFLLRVAKSIGATRFVFKKDNQNGRYNYSEMDLSFTNLADGAARVDYKVAKWVEDGQPTTT